MTKKEIKNINNQIEELMNDLSFEIIRDEETQKILISASKKKELMSYLETELSEEEQNIFFEEQKQVHVSRDRDIKIDSMKVGDYGVKLIYHRMKNGEKQYRIFISYKDENGKLVRRRYVNDMVKAAQESEKKMKEIYMNLDAKSIKKAI